MISDPSSFLPTLVFPMDEPNRAEKIKNKFQKLLASFQEKLAEPQFSENIDYEIPESEDKESEEKSANLTMLELVEFLKRNQEIKSMAEKLIQNSVPNIIGKIHKNVSSEKHEVMVETQNLPDNSNTGEEDAFSSTSLPDNTSFRSDSYHCMERTTTTITSTKTVATTTTTTTTTTSTRTTTSTESMTKTITSSLSSLSPRATTTPLSIRPITSADTSIPLLTLPEGTPTSPYNTSLPTSPYNTSLPTKNNTQSLSTQTQQLSASATMMRRDPVNATTSPIALSKSTQASSNISAIKPQEILSSQTISSESLPSSLTKISSSPIISPLSKVSPSLIQKQQLKVKGTMDEEASLKVSTINSTHNPVISNHAAASTNLSGTMNKSTSQAAAPALKPRVAGGRRKRGADEWKSVNDWIEISEDDQMSDKGNRIKRNTDLLQPYGDPIHDLEMTKLNLKKFIYDESKNDIGILKNLGKHSIFRGGGVKPNSQKVRKITK